MTKNKLVRLFLLVMAIFTLLAFAGCGGGDTLDPKEPDHIEWSFDETTGTLTISGKGNMEDYDPDINFVAPWYEQTDRITRVIIEKGVTSIGEWTFYNCSNLISIEIPASVTSIGCGAFKDCSSLASIEVPTSVMSVGDSAFKGCENLKYNEKDGVKYLGNKNAPYHVAMYADTYIKSVVLPKTTKVIAEYAFYDCSSLTSIEIPTGVMSIDAGAFYDCSSLTSIEIPASVTRIGYAAFYGCSNLISITVDYKNSFYHSDENCLIETQTKKLIRGCQNSIIPDDGSVTSIGDNAFSYCIRLTSIEIPDSVTSIGYSAFYGCSNLKNIENSDNVTSFGDFAFWGCNSLTSIEIPDGVTRIGYATFNGCGSLKFIEIPYSVTNFGDFAFSGCSSLTRINYSGTKAQWKLIMGVDEAWIPTNCTIHCTDGDIVK